jgi:hypothetical protein
MGRTWIREQKVLFPQVGIFIGDSICDPNDVTVYVTQRMQVEDQWEVRLKRQWGPS